MQKVHAKCEYVHKQLCVGLDGRDEEREHSRSMKIRGFSERG